MPTVRVPRRGMPSMTPTIMLMLIAGTVTTVVISAFALRSTTSFLHVAAPTLLAGVAIWMFLSDHYERTLPVLALYLGLLDGFLKLKTGSTLATLGRDVLLYAITAGALVRFTFTGRRLALPKLTPLVVVWVIICFAEVLNPVVPSISHALAGVRQHVEFVPLFFFGFAVMRTERRLMGLFGLLLLVAAVNGVVGLVQSNLSPAALAAWGAGYAKEVYGLGTLTGGGRTFVTASGVIHVRPPALGSDFGFGGVVAAMAIPGAMVLAAAGKRYRRYLPLVIVGVVLAVVGLATSQARVAVVSAAVGVIFFLMLAATTRGGVAAIVIAALLGLVIYFGLTSVFQGVTSSSNRYSSIAPTKVISTTINYRSGTLSVIPTYLVDYPLGDGIGSTGPAGGSTVGGLDASSLNAESEPNFLIIEVGIPGLLTMFALMFSAIGMGVRLRALADRRLQFALAAITAVLISFVASWIVGVDTANSPTSPFMWLAFGTLAYWYGEMRAGRAAVRSRRIRATLAER
ncbi:MAG: hypothetical protein ABSF58_14445 [Solirubrobacteraceae bacterium]